MKKINTEASIATNAAAMPAMVSTFFSFFFLDFVNRLGFCLVNAALKSVGIFDSCLVILIIENRGELSTVYRGHTLMSCGVLDILNAVAAEYQ